MNLVTLPIESRKRPVVRETRCLCVGKGKKGQKLDELAKLVQLGRVEVDLHDRVVARTLDSIRMWPIDFAVARMSTRLDFRGDPADELIAATSVVHDVPLLTRDAVIRRSKMVPVA